MIREEMKAMGDRLDDIYERVQALATIAQKKQAA